MAVRPLDLQLHEQPIDRTLRLVDPPPPRSGRPVAAALFLVLLAGVLGAPSIDAGFEGPPAPRAWSYRSSSALPSALDGGVAVGTGRPTSSDPAGGILFVRCTRLWRALPDGTRARMLLDMPGLSSPAFSSDARTVAFFAPDGDAMAIWMAGADGSAPRVVARLTDDGIPIAAMPVNLTWSPNGQRIAFGLLDPRRDAFSGGGAIWTYDVTDGDITKQADGWPAPFWLNRRVGYSQWSGANGPTFWSVGGGNHHREHRLDSKTADLTAATASDAFSDAWSYGRGVVVLRENDDGDLVVTTKRSYWTNRVGAEHAAPSPYVIARGSRIAIAQDTSRALVDLVDPKGDRALGILDLSSGEWSVLDYAWDGATSPAPTASGPIGAQRAARLASDMLNSLRRRSSPTHALLAADDDDRDIVPFRVRGQVTGQPVRDGSSWLVPASVTGRRDRDSWVYRHVNVRVSDTNDGRVVADLSAPGGIEDLVTLEDAKAYLADVLQDGFRWPSALPEGTKLNRKWPLDAYTWAGPESLTVTVNLTIPTEKRADHVTIAFGEVGFSLGCGGENDPEEGEVGEEPGLYDAIGSGRHRTRQVIWPASFDRPNDAFYSVYGGIPRRALEQIAASMTG